MGLGYVGFWAYFGVFSGILGLIGVLSCTLGDFPGTLAFVLYIGCFWGILPLFAIFGMIWGFGGLGVARWVFWVFRMRDLGFWFEVGLSGVWILISLLLKEGLL